jgi:tetratricopeptide (TPR) repeat protein
MAPAVQLFLDRCSRAVDGFEVARGALDTVVEICEAVDGLPLALELAAARVGTLGLSGLSRRLGSRLDLLASPHRGGDSRHRSLREVLEWSYGLLTDGAKQMLARLSVFAGGFTVTHVEEMWREESASRTLAAFEELERHSLLSALPSVDEPRFRLLGTIREFALERLAENGEDLDAGRRLVTWVSARIAGSGGRVGVGAMQFEGLEPEVDNVRAAVQWTFDHLDADASAELCNSLYVWWMSLGRRAELKRWFQGCVVPDIASEILRGRALLNLGRVEAQLSDHRESIAHLEASLDCLRGADFLRCQSLLTLAENYSLLGHVARCADTFRTAEELIVSLGDDELMCRLNLSSLYIQINEQRFEEAISTADEILRMDVTRDWADARLLAMTSRAEALRFIMRTDEANAWALRAAETAVELGNGTAAEFAWSQLASISAVMGEEARCLEFSGLALCATDLGDLDPQSVYRTALSLAHIYPPGGDDDLGMVARKLIQAFEVRYEAPALIERERAVFPLLEDRHAHVDSGLGLEELTQSMRRSVQELVSNDL